jgi:hypothetical protein
MAMDPVGTPLALTKLAYDLYNNGWVVMRNASDDVKELLEDIGILSTLLFNAQDFLPQNGPTFELLRNLEKALRDFEAIVGRYEKLGTSELNHAATQDKN